MNAPGGELPAPSGYGVAPLEDAMLTWNAPTDALLTAMQEAGLTRGSIIRRDTAYVASHPVFEPVREAMLANTRDLHGHLGVFFEIGRDSEHLMVAFIHRTERGQGAGGVRFWQYADLGSLFADGLRLSRGMSHKNALAGLWWGGGKGIIARRPGVDVHDPEVRRAVFQDYGRFITGLRGLYVTAEDAGSTPPDIAEIFKTTRHTTCIPPELGGSGNPSELTARGVVCAMEAALEARGLGTLQGKTIASEGLGNVARFMIRELLDRGVARVVAVDIDPRAIDAAHALVGNDPRLETRQIEPGDHTLLATPCDILAPNAIGATINDRSIPSIQAPIVCGAANNQLEDPARNARELQDRGILYVPDFLANRMGIVNCANEQYGVLENDPAVLTHLDRSNPEGIHQRTLEVLQRAEASGRTPADEAVLLADALCDELHPIWGDRGAAIVDALMRSGWAG